MKAKPTPVRLAQRDQKLLKKILSDYRQKEDIASSLIGFDTGTPDVVPFNDCGNEERTDWSYDDPPDHDPEDS